MTDLIGRSLGQYQIVEHIGQGGMATVYKAYQASLERYVAIKVLPPFHAKQPGFVERFAREAKAIANLNHPNIVPVHDFGLDGDYSFIVMRYIEGGRTLKEMMAGSLTLAEISDLIGQVASALDYAHGRKIIHRDVKPGNVLMDGNWALLSDFGLAKMVESSPKLTDTGTGVGTPAYMSPEQGRGEPVDYRTDIYALGVILFEILTGQIPHQAETPFGIILKRVSEPLPLPRSLNPAIPEAVEQVILKALAYKPQDRFETTLALAETFKATISQTSLKLVDVSPPAGEDWLTLPSSKGLGRTAPPAVAEIAAPPVATEFVSAGSGKTGGAASADTEKIGRPAGSVFQKFTQKTPLPLVISLGLILFVVLALGLANQEAIQAALFAAPTATPTITPDFTPTAIQTATPAPTATPASDALSLPFPPAGDDERMILIATFHTVEGIIDTSPHNEIRLAIEQAVSELDLANLRLEVEPTRLKAEDQSEAKALGDKYKASIVIWGEDTGVRITVNYLNLKTTDGATARASISETERTQMANPSAYAKFVTKDMPAQITFLSLFAVGQSYYVEQNYEEASKIIEKAAASLPPDIEPPEGIDEAYFRLGWLYQGPMGKLEAAIRAYDQAIKFNPNYSVAYYNRGLAQANSGHLAQAISDYTQAINLKSDYTNAFYNRGLAYAATDNLEQAIEDYRKATALNPDYADAWNNLCWFSSLAGQAAEGLATCDRAIELNPANGNFYDSRGLARALAGDYQGAIEDFKVYLAWAKENNVREQTRLEREAWITRLESGQNPLDEATLQRLRYE